MSTALQDAGSALAKMSATDKAQLLQWVISDLTNVFPGVEKKSGVCGGDACIAGTRVPVWSLVNARNLGMNDVDILYNYPTLTIEDLKNAWNYYRANQEEIDQLIRDNEMDS
jgi:uncharacterized protein (DUF433 family)